MAPETLSQLASARRHLHVHLRPPHHPGRGVGRVPRAHRGAAARERRLLRVDLRRPPASRTAASTGRWTAIPLFGPPRGGDRKAGPRARAHQRVPGPRPPDRGRRPAAHGALHASRARPRDVRAHDLGPRPGVLDRRVEGRRPHAAPGDHRRHAPRLLRQGRNRVPLHFQSRREGVDPPTDRSGTPRAAAPRGPLRIFEKLLAAETFERFLGTKYLGQRRYSIEGCETAVPLLDQLLEGAGERGIEEVVIGLTHRGRLNILANVVGKRPSGSSRVSRARCTRTFRPTRAT